MTSCHRVPNWLFLVFTSAFDFPKAYILTYVSKNMINCFFSITKLHRFYKLLAPGKIVSTLICQNQTSLRRKLSVAYVCRTARSAASMQAKVGAKWEDFGKLLACARGTLYPPFLYPHKMLKCTYVRRLCPLFCSYL